MLSWFDSLPLAVILLVGVILIVVEFFLAKLHFLSLKAKKWVLFNIWQVFGVVLPAFWLLRVVDSYIEALPVVIMMGYFAIVKPTRLGK